MDKKLQLETLSFVLLIVTFPVISLGATHNNTAVWVVGLIAVILGGLLPIWTRYMSHANDKPRDMGMEFDERAS
jgi:succinate-acetate transporter protein